MKNKQVARKGGAVPPPVPKAAVKPAEVQQDAKCPTVQTEAATKEEAKAAKEGVKTDWKKVVVAGIVSFLSALENTAIGVTQWPYLSQVDETATYQFYGFVNSSSKIGHAIFALIFSVWSYKTGRFRAPLVTGRLIATLACTIYLCMELVPHGRKYVFLVCSFLFGAAAGSSAVLRVYIVHVSSNQDRPRAYSIFTLCYMLSIVIGPVSQVAFSRIKYPGRSIFSDKFLFNLYTAPVWLASIINFVSMAILYTVFKELNLKKEDVPAANIFSVDVMREKVLALRSLRVPWTLVSFCWGQKMVASLSTVTLMAMITPFMMACFGYHRDRTIFVVGLCMGAVGLLSIVTSALFIIPKLKKIIAPRISFIFALVIAISMYVLSYPYPPVSSTIPELDVENGTGCNRTRYTWCDELAPSEYIFLPVVVLVMGAGMSIFTISLDTLYSRVLGKIDQTVLQGCMVVADDIMLIFGPIYASWMFTGYGQAMLWQVNGSICTIALAIWLMFFRKLGKYT